MGFVRPAKDKGPVKIKNEKNQAAIFFLDFCNTASMACVILPCCDDAVITQVCTNPSTTLALEIKTFQRREYNVNLWFFMET